MKRIATRIIVELDDVASALLRKNLMDDPDNDPRDIASAAVVFMLSDPDSDEEDGEWNTTDALTHAREWRLAGEGKEAA